MNLATRIEALRTLMRKQGVDYYYVPAADAHKNEYVPACWQRRTYISGFTGSAGDALVGLNEAYLWTDGRYFLQAEQELPQHFTLMKQQQGVAPVDGWLKQHTKGKTLAVDPQVISVAQAERFAKAMQFAGGKFLSLESNLIDAIWTDQPALSAAPIVVWSEAYAGESARAKIKRLQAAMNAMGATAHVITMLDAVAWLYNIRGADVAFNPLVIAYALVTESAAYLFVDQQKILPEQAAYFKAQGIRLMPYQNLSAELKSLSGKVLIDPASASAWVAQQLTAAELMLEASPISLMKACKNAVEIRGMHTAHIKDAVSYVKFMHWLAHNWQGHDEMSVADKLYDFRAQDPDFRDLSFDTISGYESNGAIIHYRAHAASNKKLGDQALFLLDSGAQYWQGTTDITRVFHFGKPKPIEKRHYTLVLKGHLALGNAIFPQGAMGEHLDAFARQYLWQEGLDYRHGTGHGVGCYLCVHEGPQSIAQRATNTPLQLGMVLSNEPGYYLPQHYGIRIENLCVVKSHSQTDMGEFYTFEDLTLVPYERKLIDKSLLSEQEIAWVDAYHQRVWATLNEQLPLEVQQWLKIACAPL